LVVYRFGRCILCAEYRLGIWIRVSEETAMNWVYILSGVLALAIMIYLVVALLFPEKF